MSIAALNWAWSQECPNAPSKLVLLALADKANEEGECWPGMDTVAAMAGVSQRQVSTHLGRLEQAGLVVRKRRRSSLGRLGRNVYHLNMTSGSTLPVDHEKSTSGSEDHMDPPAHRKPDVPASGSPASPATGSPPQHIVHPPEGSPQGTSGGKPRKKRKPDPIFDALIDACGLDPSELTKSARGAVNNAGKQLREIGATPEGIHARARVHRQRWPDAECTPTSLAKNYAQLGARKRSEPRPPDPNACPDCGYTPDKHDDQLCAVVKAG